MWLIVVELLVGCGKGSLEWCGSSGNRWLQENSTWLFGGVGGVSTGVDRFRACCGIRVGGLQGGVLIDAGHQYVGVRWSAGGGVHMWWGLVAGARRRKWMRRRQTAGGLRGDKQQVG